MNSGPPLMQTITVPRPKRLKQEHSLQLQPQPSEQQQQTAPQTGQQLQGADRGYVFRTLPRPSDKNALVHSKSGFKIPGTGSSSQEEEAKLANPDSKSGVPLQKKPFPRSPIAQHPTVVLRKQKLLKPTAPQQAQLFQSLLTKQTPRTTLPLQQLQEQSSAQQVQQPQQPTMPAEQPIQQLRQKKDVPPKPFLDQEKQRSRQPQPKENVAPQGRSLPLEAREEAMRRSLQQKRKYKQELIQQQQKRQGSTEKTDQEGPTLGFHTRSVKEGIYPLSLSLICSQRMFFKNLWRAGGNSHSFRGPCTIYPKYRMQPRNKYISCNACIDECRA